MAVHLGDFPAIAMFDDRRALAKNQKVIAIDEPLAHKCGIPFQWHIWWYTMVYPQKKEFMIAYFFLIPHLPGEGC